MPNQLQSNAMVWLYFTDDAVAKKGKCMYCGQLISYEKSTYSNLTRHLKRRHPNVLDNVSKKYLHYVWNHFVKETGSKAKCMYCRSYISCSNNSVGNLLRHMKNKHSTISLQNTVEFIQQDEDRLYNGPPSLPDAIEETFKTPELGIESNLNAIEMMPDNGTSSGKIEYMNTNSHSKINEDDQEVIEEIVHDAQSLQDVEMNSRMEKNSSSPFVKRTANYTYMQSRLEATRVIAQQEESFEIDRHHDISSKAALRTHDGLIGRINHFKGLKDLPVRTASFTTNIALELENLPSMQRIVAEKLISDVLFHAKLENLTEHSMILAKLSQPCMK